jgi:hypothetical protein
VPTREAACHFGQLRLEVGGDPFRRLNLPLPARAPSNRQRLRDAGWLQARPGERRRPLQRLVRGSPTRAYRKASSPSATPTSNRSVPSLRVARVTAGGRSTWVSEVATSNGAWEAASTDAFAFIIMATTMGLDYARLARVNRNHDLHEAWSWLLSGRHLRIGLGDTSGGSQGSSGTSRKGLPLAMKAAQ